MKDSTKLWLKVMGATFAAGWFIAGAVSNACRFGEKAQAEELAEKLRNAESGDEITIPCGKDDKIVIRKR